MDLTCYEVWDLDELLLFCHDVPKEIVCYSFFPSHDKTVPYYPAQAVATGCLTCDEHLQMLWSDRRPFPQLSVTNTAYPFRQAFARPLLSIAPLERMAKLYFKDAALDHVVSFAQVKALFDFWCPRSFLSVKLEMAVVKPPRGLFNPFVLTHKEPVYVWLRTLVFCRYYYTYLPLGLNQVLPLCLYEHHALCLWSAQEWCTHCILWESCWEYMFFALRQFKDPAPTLFKTSRSFYMHVVSE